MKKIVRLAPNEYVEWSSVVDAPISFIVDQVAAIDAWGVDRVGQAEDPEEYLAFNKAGPNESHLRTVDQIRERYQQPVTSE